jgi:hypothetical protein
MNWIGLVAALTAFFSIWSGHVAVRKIEFLSPTVWFPTTIFAVLGLIVEFISLSTPQRLPSTFFGILGITLLFDALEFTRQQTRIKKGHAPANPNNPRHARILADHSSATTFDFLKRDPIGHVVSIDEANELISSP